MENRQEKYFLYVAAVAVTCVCAVAGENSVFAPDGVPFVVAEKAWPADGLGNHRAVVRVSETGDVARAVLK